MYPQIIGTPSGSLNSKDLQTKFGDRAGIGAKAEQQTADNILNPLCSSGGPTVLHDLRLRSANKSKNNYEANIDHILISGNTVVIIDTKTWKPGFYWTLRGTTRRGFTKAPHLDKETMAWAYSHIGALLRQRGISHKLTKPILIIWPSSTSKSMRLGFYRPKGASPVLASRAKGTLKKYRQSANQDIVAALYPLIIKP